MYLATWTFLTPWSEQTLEGKPNSSTSPWKSRNTVSALFLSAQLRYTTINSSMDNKWPIYQFEVPINVPEEKRIAIILLLWQPEKVVLSVLGVFSHIELNVDRWFSKILSFYDKWFQLQFLMPCTTHYMSCM